MRPTARSGWISAAALADRRRTVETDHVICATGYRADIDRLTFLDAGLRTGLKTVARAPVLSNGFESSRPGYVLRRHRRRSDIRPADALHARRRVRRTADLVPPRPERRVIADELRGGTGDTVFVICGAGGAAEELAGLARALDGDPRVIALVPRPAPDDTEPATTVEAMADGRRGARTLASTARPVPAAGLFPGWNRRAGDGTTAGAGRRARQLPGNRGRVLRPALLAGGAVHPGERSPVRRSCAGRCSASRRSRPRASCVGASAGSPSGWAAGSARRASRTARPNMTVQEANLLAMARWRPRVFEGEVVLFTTEAPEFGCDLADLWRPWLPRMQRPADTGQPPPAGPGARRHRPACEGRRRGARRRPRRPGFARWSRRPSAGRAPRGLRSSCTRPAATCRRWRRGAARCTRSPQWSAATRSASSIRPGACGARSNRPAPS